MVCETCWADASRDALLLGGSVVDRYKRGRVVAWWMAGGQQR